MIFRDLIPREEFVVGQKAYDSIREMAGVMTQSVRGNDAYPLSLHHDTYTENGIYYAIQDYEHTKDFCKMIITNKADRIFPIKYKPL